MARKRRKKTTAFRGTILPAAIIAVVIFTILYALLPPPTAHFEMLFVVPFVVGAGYFVADILTKKFGNTTAVMLGLGLIAASVFLLSVVEKF